MAKKYLTKTELNALADRAADLAADLHDAEKRGIDYTKDDVVTAGQAATLNAVIEAASNVNRLILTKLRNIEDQNQLRADLQERAAKRAP